MNLPRLSAAGRELFQHVSERIDTPFSIRLWDGTVIPLGPNADPNLLITIRNPQVIGAIVRRPTLETVLRQWATGGIDTSGADLLTFIEKARAEEDQAETP